MAASSECSEECTFGEDFGVGDGADEGLQEQECIGVIGAAFDTESALTDGGEKGWGLEDQRDTVLELQALEPGFGEEDGVEFAVIELFQAGVDVAADFGELQIGAKMFELRLTAGAASADFGVCREFFKLLGWRGGGGQQEHIAAGVRGGGRRRV